MIYHIIQEGPDTRTFVAMSHKTMTHTIHMLTRDPNPLVRAYAIARPQRATRGHGNGNQRHRLQGSRSRRARHS